MTYQPEGSDTPQEWEFKLGKLRSADIEAIERRTGMDFGSDYLERLLKGNALARRALLWILLRRSHPFLKFDEIDFAHDEVMLEMDLGEMVESRDALAKSLESGVGDRDELEQYIAALDAQIDEARQAAQDLDVPGGPGKVDTPS